MDLQLLISGEKSRKLSENDGHLHLDDQKFDAEVQKSANGNLLVVIGNGVKEVEIIERTQKSYSLKVDGRIFKVDIKDGLDQILDNMGLNSRASKTIQKIEAPMPGLIYELLVQEGQSVKKGESLLILEAMKMENLIKAPEDISIDKIHVSKGENVEKGQSIMTLK